MCSASYTLPDPETRVFSNRVLYVLNELRYGRSVDEHGWNFMVRVKPGLTMGQARVVKR